MESVKYWRPENNEYGYCLPIKATKSVLDRIELESRTAPAYTKERIDRRLWNLVAIREAVINSIVHNDVFGFRGGYPASHGAYICF